MLLVEIKAFCLCFKKPRCKGYDLSSNLSRYSSKTSISLCGKITINIYSQLFQIEIMPHYVLQVLYFRIPFS